MTHGPARPTWVVSLGWNGGREQTLATQDRTEALKYANDGYEVVPNPREY